VLLLENDEAAVSLAQCSAPEVGGTWPCWHLAAGLADVDIDKILEPMPRCVCPESPCTRCRLSCISTSARASVADVDIDKIVESMSRSPL